MLLDCLHPNDEGGGLVAESKGSVTHGNLQPGRLLPVGAVGSRDHVSVSHQSSTATLALQAGAKKQGNLDILGGK